MAAREYELALPRILVYEGGKVDDPQDPGGRTNKGVTQSTYNTYRRRAGLPLRDVWLIADSEVSAIYKQMYWDRIGGDLLPKGVAFCVFDAAVNSGVSQATKWLQRALGRTYTGAVDGDFGPKTVEAALADNDNDALIARFCSLRLAMLKGLKTWNRFRKGWSARVANVLKIAQSWASGSVGPNPVDVASDGGNRKAFPADIKKPMFGETASNSATGVGLAGSTASQLAETLDPLKDHSKAILYAFLAVTVAGILATAYVAWSRTRQERLEKAEIETEVDIGADDDFVPVAVNDNLSVDDIGKAV